MRRAARHCNRASPARIKNPGKAEVTSIVKPSETGVQAGFYAACETGDSENVNLRRAASTRTRTPSGIVKFSVP
jgi:hypothetical protein